MAAAILSILVLILTSLVAQVSKTWTSTLARVEQFREARSGFEVMTRRLSQATLNTYDDYVDASGNVRTPSNMSTFIPSSYARQSELRFLSGPASLVLANTALSPTFMVTHGVFFKRPSASLRTRARNRPTRRMRPATAASKICSTPGATTSSSPTIRPSHHSSKTFPSISRATATGSWS